MDSFKIKVQNRQLLLISVLCLLVLFTVSAIYFSDFFISGGMEKFLIIAVIPFFALMGLLARICNKVYTIEITQSDFTVRKNNKVEASVQLDRIMLIKHRGGTNEGNDALIIYADNQKKSLLNVLANNQSAEIKSMLERLLQSATYKKSQKVYKNTLWNEYYNEALFHENTSTIVRINKKGEHTNKVVIWALVIFFALLLGGSILPFFINPKKFYEYERTRVLYGDKELVGVNPDSVKVLSYTVIKDSSHVYYKGEILEWADRATFTCLRDPFYYDKNGVYFETSNFYSKNKIKPIEGEYDAATFQSVGGYSSHYYKDKNNVYEINISLMDGNKSPLKKVEVEGLDVASFQMLESSYWYADKNRIYFGTWQDLRPCPEIDRNTFEILSFTTVKDKNHVYYLTRDLSSDTKKATEKDGYAILEGADAPSFRRINDKNYEDKNTTWTIRSGGEEISPRKGIE